jgi:hypothetical protein
VQVAPERTVTLITMTMKRVHLALSPAQLKLLERLSAKLGLDKTNTMRYCINRVAEQEEIGRERPGRSGA